MHAFGKARLTIIGLGLMGGSLGMALRKRRACHRVWGVARRPETITRALELGAIEGGTLYLAEGVADADVVVLATPVRTIIELIPRLGPLLPRGCLLTDVGSTKAAIVEAMGGLPVHVQPLGGHPMCGKEVAGIEAAEADLYAGALWALTPLAHTSPEALEMGRALARAVGARPLLLDALRHDRLVAAISHLPYLLAVALVGLAEEVGAEDELVWDLAASGFRDTSRLAASEVTMMLDILLTNRSPVAEMLQRFGQHLEELAALLEGRDQVRLRHLLESARQRRGGMFR
jgi:prephenate dehydrogenase